MLRNQKGITLVALVVTIIVLLILAGVSITMVAGDNGIATKAKKAASQTDIGNAQDALNMAISEAQADYYESFAEGNTASLPTVSEINDALDGYELELNNGANLLISTGASTNKTVDGKLYEGTKTNHTSEYKVTITINYESGMIASAVVSAN